jgi:hypothetical protein
MFFELNAEVIDNEYNLSMQGNEDGQITLKLMN